MGREENAVIFQDTEKMVKENAALQTAVKNSTAKQKLILEKDVLKENFGCASENAAPARVIVSKKRSYEAAAAYKGMKTCVLNFASATNPGGGVIKGSSAQEECLCRCSTLYFSLNTKAMWDGFYTPHRNAHDPIHNDDIIYTPEVYVIKTDTANPKRLPQAEWYPVDVLTCAAPNLKANPSNQMNPHDGAKGVMVSDKELLAIHEKRFERILKVATEQGCEALILGAFGCGAFRNSPVVVARAARRTVEKYRQYFKVIEFAVYCPPKDDSNYKTFSRELHSLL